MEDRDPNAKRGPGGMQSTLRATGQQALSINMPSAMSRETAGIAVHMQLTLFAAHARHTGR